MVRLHDPPVGRDDVAGIEDRDVIPDDVVDRHLNRHPVAQHRRAERQPCLEGCHRRFGPCFLHEAERRAHDDDRQDDRSVYVVTDGEAHEARGDENEHEGARDLRNEDRQDRAAAAAPYCVGAFSLEPGGGVRRAQPRGQRRLGDHQRHGHVHLRSADSVRRIVPSSLRRVLQSDRVGGPDVRRSPAPLEFVPPIDAGGRVR